MLTSVLIVLAAMRARRRKRETLSRWGEEEANMDRLRAEARERQLKRLREAETAAPTASVASVVPQATPMRVQHVHHVRRPEPPDYLVPIPMGDSREADVPTIRHDGRDHTLH